MTASLLADQLRDDPRIEEAKKLLLAAVAEHSETLVSVRPPNPELTVSYEKLLAEFGSIRGNNIFFPYLGSGIGNGPFVELADGSVKLDMITGIEGNLQQNTNSCDIVRLLTETACQTGAELKHCFLTTSGAMANENSLKMAFQKNHPANRVIAFSHCFAGRTLGLAPVTDKAKYRVGLPDTIPVDYIPFFNYKQPEKSTQYAVRRLKHHIARYPGKHAALWMELVQGEGGYYEGDTDYFKAIIEVAKENNIAVIVDEVQSFCRTTRPFAFQHFGLDKLVDLVTIGKISQVCATLFTSHYNPKPGLISQTFTGSTWAMYAAHAIVNCTIILPPDSRRSARSTLDLFLVLTGLAGWLRLHRLTVRLKSPKMSSTDCSTPA